jgi:hypothetical protein
VPFEERSEEVGQMSATSHRVKEPTSAEKCRRIARAIDRIVESALRHRLAEVARAAGPH